MITEQQAAAELLRRKYGRNTLAEFAQAIDVPGKPVTENEDEWLFEPVETVAAAHHILLMDTLDLVFERKIKNLMVFMPPGSAKSTYTSVVYPAYAMGKRPGSRFIMGSYASSIAWKQSRRTRQIVKSSKFQPIFDTALVRGNQSVEEWALDNGSEYMAGGILAGMTGNRATDLLIDDPVAGREDAESETIRKKTREAYEDDLTTRLMPNGATVVMQTRWHEQDLAGGILPEDWDGQSGWLQCRDGQKWYVLCLPAICDRADDPLHRKIGDRLWPEWFTAEHFEKFRNNPRTWSSLFQQKPRPTEGAEFKNQWLQTYLKAPPKTNKIILVDPSSGKDKNEGDYSCFWVVALGPDQNAYIVDCVRDRLNLAERVDTMMELHRKWKPVETRYERYGLMADTEAIRHEQERQQYRFKITEVAGAIRKEDRIRRLIPWFSRGRVYLPVSLAYTNTLGQTVDLVLEFGKEYGAFPVGRTDDMMDSLSRLDEPGLNLPFPQEETRPARSVRPYRPSVPGMGPLG